MTRFKAFSSASGLVAALSMVATPAAAVEFPAQAPMQSAVPMAKVLDSNSENAERHRRHRYRHRRHNRGIDAGDVLAGVLIIGGIAAIASAASNSNNRRERVNQPRYRQPASTARNSGGEGIDNAVNICLREIERNVRVEAVDTVNRSGSGWDVSGTLYNGDGFTCRIDNNGRVSDVAYGGRTAQLNTAPHNYSQVEDRQYSDDRYAAAWDREEGRTAQVDVQQSGPQPAYPGGPLPGEDGYEEARGG